MLSKYALAATAAGIVILAGYVHGLWTGRWRDAPALERAVERLEQVPRTIGDWHGEDQQLDVKAAERAGFRGYLLRRYENRRTGKVVILLLGCGPFGPMSVHTPDVCYQGAGYRVVGQARTCSVASGKDSAAEFWMAKFTKPDAILGTNLRIYWSWNAQGDWQVPNNPRWTFAGASSLYKMYVINQLNPADEPADECAGKLFLQELLPELQQALIPRE